MIADYATGLEKLSFNGEFFVGAPMAVSLQQTTQTDDDDQLMLYVLRCQLTLGTSCDQCRSTVQ